MVRGRLDTPGVGEASASRSSNSLRAATIVAVLASIVPAAAACHPGGSKADRCRKAEETIVRLAFDAEKKLGSLTPAKEKLGDAQIRSSVLKTIDPDGTFVQTCVRDYPDETVACIAKASKLSDLGRCK
jgi:hypothetical protein